MKKQLLLAGALLLLALPLSAKGQKGEGSRAEAAVLTTAYPETGEGPLTEEPLTLSALIASTGWVPDIKTNRLALLLEERTNIRIEWVETGHEQFKDKLSILIAAGELPDIVLPAGKMSKIDYERYGSSGVFADLTPYIGGQTHYLPKLLAENPAGRSYMEASDGKIYFLPRFEGVYHMTLPNKFWINRKWLETLGLEMPATTEEFRRVLQAFKTRDPNGNGQADEIPLTGSIRDVEDSASFLISSFIPAGGGDYSGVTGQNNYVFIMEGRPVFTADKEAFRQGLRYVKSLFDEGLLDPAAFTQKRDQVKPLVDGGADNRVGGMMSHHPGNFSSLSDMEAGRFHQYAAMAPLKGPAGFASTPWVNPADLKIGALVSADCPYPEAAVRWLDYFYKEEISVISKIGFEGEHWESPGPGVIGLNGKQARFRDLAGQSIHEQNAILAYMGPLYATGFNESQEKPAGFSYEAMLFEATEKAMAPYKAQAYPYTVMSMEEKDRNEFVQLRQAIHGYATESADRFITGDLDLDKDWDAYLRQLNDLGLDRFLALLQKYYK